MTKAYFRSGTTVTIDEKCYEVDRQISETEWQLMDKSSGRFVVYEWSYLLERYAANTLTLHNHARQELALIKNLGVQRVNADFDQLPEDLQEEAKTRFAYVTRIRSESPRFFTDQTLSPIAEAVWKTLHKPETIPHWHTLKRWWDRFQESGEDIRSLVTKHDNKGNRQRRYPSETLAFVEQAVSEAYLSSQRCTAKETLLKAKELVQAHNKTLPSPLQTPYPTLSLVKRAIDAVPQFERVAARYGWTEAKRRFRTVLGELGAEHLLQKVEIDHTVADIVVLDDYSYMPLGRPYITLALEILSRSVLGLYIGFEPPSFASVAQCLKHAFTPKTGLNSLYPSVKNEWGCHGIPLKIVVDNGLEFHSKHFENTCHSLGIEIDYAPRKEGWKKPHVERVLGTMSSDLLHNLPGTTFSSIDERGDYNSLKEATITLSMFREIVIKWIVDIYHQRKHRTLGQPPAVVWRDHYDPSNIPFAPSIAELDALVGATATRVLNHEGIQINNLKYNSRELGELRKRVGPEVKVVVRYDPTDLEFVHVIDPETNASIRATALKRDYAKGLSKWSHDVCRRYARDHLGDHEDDDALLQARAAIQDIVKAAIREKRSVTRKRAARFSTTKKVQDTPRQSPAISAAEQIPSQPTTHLPEKTHTFSSPPTDSDDLIPMEVSYDD